MLRFLLLFTSLLAQVYQLYGANSSIVITSTETSLLLQWSVTDNSTYTVNYGIQGNNSGIQTDIVPFPAEGDTSYVHLIAGLHPGEHYTVDLLKDSVTVFNDLIATKPNPVQNLQALAVTTTSVNITWQPHSNSIQDTYQVLVTGVTNVTFTFDSPNITDPLYELQGLSHSEEYRAVVVGYSHGQVSNQSEPLLFNTAPLPPTDLIVIAIDTKRLNITWRPAVTSIQDSYKIGYMYNSTTTNNEVVTNITCPETYCEVLMPGVAGQVYDITVYSVLGSVVSEGISTLHSTIPLAITSLREEISNDTSIHLHWTSPDMNSSLFRHFIVNVESAFGSLNWELNGNQSELGVTDLNLGSMYNVTIYVSTGYEISSPLKKTFYTFPMQIDSITLHDMLNGLKADWFSVQWSINKSATIDNYILDINPRPENTTFPLSLSPEVANYTFTGLIGGQAYLVSIVTVLSTKQSDPVNFTVTTLPNKPENVIMTALSSSEIKVTWTPPSGKLHQYVLRLTTGNNIPQRVENVNGTDTSYTFLDLFPGTEYQISIQSLAYQGLLGDYILQTVVTNPTAPRNLTIEFVDEESIMFKWIPPSDYNFEQYQVTIDPSNVQLPVDLNKNETSLTYDGLRAGQLYTISVITVQQGVRSESISVRAVTSPLPVVFLEAVAYNKGLNISWSISNDSLQSGFIVSYQELHNGTPLFPPTTILTNEMVYSTTIPDLFPGGTYKVRVQVWQNVSGESSGSLVQEVNGTTKPKSVENLTAQFLSADVLDVDWTAPLESIQDHYIIKHRPSLRDTDASWVENSTFPTNLTLPDLFPGEKYEIEVYAVSEHVLSDVMAIAVVVAPLPPKSVDILSDRTTTVAVTLQWMYNSSATYVESWQIANEEDGRVLETVPRTGTATIIEQEVTGLEPGYKYNLTVQSIVESKVSEGVKVQAVTKPLNNVHLSFNTPPTSSSIQISYDIEENDIFDSIVFSLSLDSKTIVKKKTDTNKTIQFSDLEAGALYTVEVHTVSGLQSSERKTIDTQTLPNKASVTYMSGSNDVTLTVTFGAGGTDRYRVQCYDPNNVVKKDLTLDKTQAEHTVHVTDLQPYTSYRCVVSTIFKAFDNSVEITVLTSQAAPSAVRNLKAMENAPREITLTWDIPQEQNGAIQIYMIHYVGEKGTEKVTDSLNVTFTPTSTVIKELKAGYQYTFTLRAKTVAVGVPASVTIELKTYSPPLKDGVQATPKLVDASVATPKPHSLLFNLTNAFSPKYGDIVAYTVIVTTEKNAFDRSSTSVLPGWRDARRDPTIKSYQAISNCSTLFTVASSCDGRVGGVQKRAVNEVQYKLFEVGAETGCENIKFCNGPLKPDTTYYVTLRAYTTMQFSDTPLSGPIKTAVIPPTEESSNVGGIVGGIIAAIVVIAIVVIVVLFLRRRLREKSNMYRQNPGQQLTPRTSLSNRKSCCPVPLSDFKEHVRGMMADSDFRYAEQFEDLKEVGRGQPCVAAELPCNRGKNRFTNILPYDHSRVKLLPIDDDEGSDYINANYAPGFNSKREYIVSQGPLPATRDDFWRLMWEQNVRNIVMLTKCSEKGREKCDHYWPNGSDAVFYGDLQVAALNETLFPDWTITEFKVSLGDQSRQIRHFHFTSWPDFGVPKKEQVLVRFVRMVREKLMKDGGPIIVHCSAGVGRSGTFVVIDTLLQRIRTHSTVDIFNTVATLRKERVWMVQTEQQYICIHNSLLCVLEGREDEHIYDNMGHSNIAFEDDEGVDLN